MLFLIVIIIIVTCLILHFALVKEEKIKFEKLEKSMFDLLYTEQQRSEMFRLENRLLKQALRELRENDTVDTNTLDLKAIRMLVHPDKHKNSGLSNKIFKQINSLIKK